MCTSTACGRNEQHPNIEISIPYKPLFSIGGIQRNTLSRGHSSIEKKLALFLPYLRTYSKYVCIYLRSLALIVNSDGHVIPSTHVSADHDDGLVGPSAVVPVSSQSKHALLGRQAALRHEARAIGFHPTPVAAGSLPPGYCPVARRRSRLCLPVPRCLPPFLGGRGATTQQVRGGRECPGGGFVRASAAAAAAAIHAGGRRRRRCRRLRKVDSTALHDHLERAIHLLGDRANEHSSEEAHDPCLPGVLCRR